MAKPHKNKNRAPLKPLNVPTLALSTLGLGFLRPAPGTWGSLPPVVIVFACMLAGASTQQVAVVLIILLIASSAVNVAFGRYAETRFALPDGTPQKDAPEVVIDETAGQSLALLAIPIEAALLLENGWVSPDVPHILTHPEVFLAMAFILFRALDTLKPWPARALEKLPHGWGVLLDDLAAGAYAGIAHGLIYFIATR
ncbi:MAG: phosphatidylglycerophosphatase A [Phycisphaerales bacterium]|nr:phosphatidylglycerophosphatase A [Phycisphaerales bacterium]